MSLAVPGSLAGLLHAQALRHPAAAALLAPDHRPLSYDGLDSHVRKTVSHLNAFGIGRGDRIALVLPNGPEMAAAFLAAAVCGASAPLNPAYRAEEFEYYLADLQAKAVILPSGSDSPARAVAQRMGLTVIDLTPEGSTAGLFTLAATLHPAPKGSQLLPPMPASSRWSSPEDLALILHTSGTTARPKMTPLTQANLCSSSASIAHSLQLGLADRCLNVMPLFHIHGLMASVLASLSAGASVVCTPGFDDRAFFDWLDAFQPTWYTAVPTMHQAVLAQAAQNAEVIERSRLRFVRSSSASLPPPVLAELEHVFGTPVIEAYGMTEASHQMASNPLPPLPHKPGSVGPAAGPEIAIMAENGPELLPSGVVGEVVIRGPGVTTGYLNNPEANARSFTFGWFRTGDQGYFDEDGYLFLTGRLKEIVNRGGEKVSPREVDEAFLEHPAVAQAVAFAVPHATLGDDLAVAVVLKPGAETTLGELRAFAFERLAAFKVPSQIAIVDAIPKGPTGKLQRMGLATVLADRLRTPYAAPQTSTETAIAGLWTEILGGARVGRTDNFFVLGGDSIQAIRMVSRIASVLELDLPPGLLFRHPTVAEFAVIIENAFDRQATGQAEGSMD